MGRDHKKSNQDALTRGSDTTSSEPRFLAIGQITKAHGVRGEVSVHVLTEFVERFDRLEAVLVGKMDAGIPYQVASRRWHRDRVLIRFEGVLDRTAAENLRGQYLQIPIDEAIALEPDAYYVHQLIGLSVVTDTGRQLGQLSDILETGANDVYIVDDGENEILLPATKEVVTSIDLTTKVITIHLIDGLLS
ncbi:MAG: ribosome maturation factor RimM [Chloroflexota bacterium]